MHTQIKGAEEERGRKREREKKREEGERVRQAKRGRVGKEYIHILVLITICRPVSMKSE